MASQSRVKIAFSCHIDKPGRWFPAGVCVLSTVLDQLRVQIEIVLGYRE